MSQSAIAPMTNQPNETAKSDNEFCRRAASLDRAPGPLLR
ncbi:hypothetical protein ACVIJ6_002070 [Bradyrhizobium sp. USDA 4369]